MKQEINPQESSRAEAFSMWMSSPMPMVTLTKTFDVSRLVKISKRTGMKFTMLMCWCIGKAASSIEEFFLLPDSGWGSDDQRTCSDGQVATHEGKAIGRMFRFDRLAINIVVQNVKGGISLCDVPFSNDIEQFNADYLELTSHSAKTCESTALDDYMIVGTSALPQTELDSIVNQYSGRYNNPFLAWGKYRKRLFKTTLPISFQFHHAQMDGGHAARFLQHLQNEINLLSEHR